MHAFRIWIVRHAVNLLLVLLWQKRVVVLMDFELPYCVLGSYKIRIT